MKITKLLSAAVVMLILSATAIQVKAQVNEMTPYSRYGYGILNDRATSTQRSMGAVGYAMNNSRQINVMNPASYAAMDSLTFLFDIGLDLTTMWTKETVDGKTLSDNSFGGGLDYVTMQFPLCKFMAASVGLVPYSSVGYSFGSEIENGLAAHQGYGSLNELYVGLSGKIFKGFTLGANVSYLFGMTYEDNYSTSDEGHSTLFETQLEVRDWNIQLGAQYSFDINPRNSMTLGLVYSPGKTLLGNARMYKYDTNQDAEPTIVAEQKMRGNYSTPDTWGAGISYNFNRRLTVEADFTYQPWSKVNYKGISPDTEVKSEGNQANFADRTKYALGLQYVPNYRGSYMQRVNYRLGAYYNRDYVMIHNNNVRDFGLTAGFGFPVPTFKTTVNVGFEWKHRQGTPDPLIKEDYFNITIGVNFNEMWFRKSKIY